MADEFRWQDYHHLVREAIGRFDNLLVTLWLQTLPLAGATVVAINPSESLPQTLRLVLEGSAFFVSLAYLGVIWIYANLLERAVIVAKAVESQKLFDADTAIELKLTHYLDQFQGAGANKGKYFYVSSTLIVPLVILLLFVLDLAGAFDSGSAEEKREALTALLAMT